MFVLQNLSRLISCPVALQEKVFAKLFEAAKFARFCKSEQRCYEDSLKAYCDIVNAINTTKRDTHEEGREEGRLEGVRSVAANPKRSGMGLAEDIRLTELSENEILML